MYSFLLKRALPFTLTFAAGAALGGLVGLFGRSEKKADYVLGTRTYEFGSRCRGMRRHNLVAESKPLVILFKPDARWPRGGDMGKGLHPAQVLVTFGADGKVQKVRPLASWFHVRDEELDEAKAAWEAVERAARQIKFTPETINSMPVSVEKEVEIRFIAD